MKGYELLVIVKTNLGDEAYEKIGENLQKWRDLDPNRCSHVETQVPKQSEESFLCCEISSPFHVRFGEAFCTRRVEVNR